MLFNSYIFILAFLPLVVIGYYLFNKYFQTNRAALFFLIAASFVFYGYYNWTYLLILITSIAANWLAIILMRKKEDTFFRKTVMIAGILFNTGLIFYFKYYDFFIKNINTVFDTDFNVRNIVLPLGISFFTFQQISFVVDAYRHETDDYNLVEYMAFVSFFPQLVAGPIVLHDELVPQFRDESKRTLNWEKMSRGLYLFAVGLAKKVLIADIFGIAVNWGYSNVDYLSTIDAIVVIISYTLQIYFDFSGYCDMASGIASMFHIGLPMNFDSPYKAASIIEFWKRWHMTLTRFLRRYIYFPLGGSKKGEIRTYINIMIVFIVSGIWHGANWTFIIWGGIHGAAQCLNRRFKKQWEKCHLAFQWLMTFTFVSFTWVIFRADSMAQAGKIIWRSINFRNLAISPELIECFNTVEIKAVKWLLSYWDAWNIFSAKYYINGFVMFSCILAGLFIVLNKENAQRKTVNYHIGTALWTAVLIVWGIMSLSGVSTFLYFNF